MATSPHDRPLAVEIMSSACDNAIAVMNAHEEYYVPTQPGRVAVVQQLSTKEQFEAAKTASGGNPIGFLVGVPAGFPDFLDPQASSSAKYLLAPYVGTLISHTVAYRGRYDQHDGDLRVLLASSVYDAMMGGKRQAVVGQALKTRFFSGDSIMDGHQPGYKKTLSISVGSLHTGTGLPVDKGDWKEVIHPGSTPLSTPEMEYIPFEIAARMFV